MFLSFSSILPQISPTQAQHRPNNAIDPRYMAQDRPSKHAPQTAEDDEFLALTTFLDHIFLNATAGPGSTAMFARKL